MSGKNRKKKKKKKLLCIVNTVCSSAFRIKEPLYYAYFATGLQRVVEDTVEIPEKKTKAEHGGKKRIV